MTEDQAKRMVKRKNDAPNKKEGLDGWIYKATKKASGWIVERRRKDGFGFTLYRQSAD